MQVDICRGATLVLVSADDRVPLWHTGFYLGSNMCSHGNHVTPSCRVPFLFPLRGKPCQAQFRLHMSATNDCSSVQTTSMPDVVLISSHIETKVLCRLGSPFTFKRALLRLSFLFPPLLVKILYFLRQVASSQLSISRFPFRPRSRLKTSQARGMFSPIILQIHATRNI